MTVSLISNFNFSGYSMRPPQVTIRLSDDSLKTYGSSWFLGGNRELVPGQKIKFDPAKEWMMRNTQGMEVFSNKIDQEYEIVSVEY